MIKLIVSDMDGTLLDNNTNLNREFFEVYEQLREKGIKFIAASGRQYLQLFHSFEPYGKEMGYVAENGALVVLNGEELYLSIINKEYVREIIREYGNMEGVYLALCGKHNAYLNTKDKWFIGEAPKYYHNYEVVNDLLDVEDDILKISIYDVKGSEENSLQLIRPKWGEKLEVVASTENFLDIFNRGVDKGKGLKLLKDRLNIRPEEMMVFGDYYNDVNMLKMTEHSYAMENSPDDIKEIVNYIAKSNEDNGVLEVIKEKILKK